MGDWTFHNQGDRTQQMERKKMWQDERAWSLNSHTCTLLVSYHPEPSLQKGVWGRARRHRIPRKEKGKEDRKEGKRKGWEPGMVAEAFNASVSETEAGGPP